MKILLVGYGRMGREVENVLLQRGHSVAGTVDPLQKGCSHSLSDELLDSCDCVLEFSLADAVIPNARKYAERQKPAVVGTTGWEKELDILRGIVTEKNGTCLYGSNFSIGAHILLHLTGYAVTLMNANPEYDIWVHETHHNRKADSPSGTALMLAETILRNTQLKTRIYSETLHRQPKPEELHVSSSRGGSVPGIHTVTLDSPADSIVIEHSARNRSGLAVGAVKAAEWLVGKKGLFTVEDFIRSLFQGGKNDS